MVQGLPDSFIIDEKGCDEKFASGTIRPRKDMKGKGRDFTPDPRFYLTVSWVSWGTSTLTGCPAVLKTRPSLASFTSAII